MQLHTLKSKTKRITSTQVARGGKRGKTAGRGTKGQKARAGHKIRPEFRDVIKRMPKLRGRGKNSNKTIQLKPVTIALAVIELSFENGEKVTPKTLMQKGIITIMKGKTPKVKILGRGEITKKVNVSSCEVSATVKASIEKVGGTVTA